MNLTRKILVNIIDKVGTELEGAVNQSYFNTSLFHHDGSVNVVNRNELQECECSNSCSCYECERCSASDDLVRNCEADCCQVCASCEDYIDSCSCYNHNIDLSCQDCNHTTTTACETHRNQEFNRNSMTSCDDTYYDCRGRCDCEIEHTCDSDRKYIDGELVSPPLNKNELEGWIREYYPWKTNHTCGAHQHISTTKMKYMAILMDKRFHAYLIRRLYKWGRNTGVRENSDLFKRLKGEVQWCINKYEAIRQIHETGRTPQRYRTINYSWNIKSHDDEDGKQRKTMEIRVLPAFRMVDLTVKAEIEVMNIVEKFVRDNIDSLKIRHKTITMEVMV